MLIENFGGHVTFITVVLLNWVKGILLVTEDEAWNHTLRLRHWFYTIHGWHGEESDYSFNH